MLFQASDDYYDRWDAANFVRILRYAAAFFAVLLPGMYIALAGFHPEALPLSFALSLRLPGRVFRLRCRWRWL